MERVPLKASPRLFDYAIAQIQAELAGRVSWLDHIFGACEKLTDVKDGKRFHSANVYTGAGQYEQIAPCQELGNFSFFVLRDPEVIGKRDTNVVKSPFSLIIWYDMRKVSLPYDDRNREAIKGQIMAILNSPRFPWLTLNKIYERPENVFSDFSYDYTNNQFLMSPYAGLRIDGEITVRVPCRDSGSAIVLYDTSDANVTPEDVLEGIIAYGSNGRIVGTLNYNEIYQRLLAI